MNDFVPLHWFIGFNFSSNINIFYEDIKIPTKNSYLT